MFSILSASLLTALALTTGPTTDEAVVSAQLPLYPLQVCVVSGKDLGVMGDPIDVVQDGRLVRLCCKGCVKKLAAGAETYLTKLDEAVIAAQAPSYPLDACVVSGEPLGGEMGDAIDMVYEGRLVRLCCNGCRKDFAKSPTDFLAKIDAALIESQIAHYPLDTCPISNEALVEGEIVDMLYGTQLVRLCCAPCEKKVRANPQPTLDLIAMAGGAHGGEHAGHGDHGDDGHGDDGHGDHAGDGHGDHGGHGDHDH